MDQIRTLIARAIEGECSSYHSVFERTFSPMTYPEVLKAAGRMTPKELATAVYYMDLTLAVERDASPQLATLLGQGDRDLSEQRAQAIVGTSLLLRALKHCDRALFEQSLEDLRTAAFIRGRALTGSWDVAGLKLFATSGALAKLAKDPKQQDKAQVRECWELWKAKPDRYKSKAAFARDMVGKYQSLINTKVIEGWCRKWDSQSAS